MESLPREIFPAAGMAASWAYTASVLIAAGIFSLVMLCGLARSARQNAISAAAGHASRQHIIAAAIRKNFAGHKQVKAGSGQQFRQRLSLRHKLLLAGCDAGAAAWWGGAIGWGIPALLCGIAFSVAVLYATPPGQAAGLTLFGFLAGRLLGPAIVSRMISRRRFIINRALPDAADALAMCLMAGLGLDAALKKTVQGFAIASPPLAGELQRTIAECVFLKNRALAFQNLVNRVPTPEMRRLAAQLGQADRHGLPAAKALRALACDMREATAMAAECRAASLPPLLAIPLVLFFLPGVLVIVAGPALLRFLSGQ